ncbi:MULTISPECIES: branched-chain amino acid ABC transporter permease [Halorussus]|uniref:branched-chain amino acid ABC transporter permease n=1 Tax=Halorussus TaxID=1070314 RepID=UPI000E2196AA|nr:MULTISPECIES: branched-chain amino acid ABC transporter permease [Halorussus]NHN61650.1 branched-chain amino acid ABC transporter permease [Halorussus sp. JP-T4]
MSEVEDIFTSRRRMAVAAVVVLYLLAVPFITTAYVTEIFFTGLVFVMLGVSWNLLAGYAGQVSLGHAAFFGVGAFVAAWVTTPARANLPEALSLPGAPAIVTVLFALVVGTAVAALLAAVTGPIMFRLTGHYFAIGTLALASIIQLVMLDQRQLTGGSTGYYVNEYLGDAGMFLLTLAATLGMVAVVYRIVDSRSGLGMRAIHDDEEAASSLGVNPLKYKLYAFVISSGMAGLAGSLYSQFTLYVNPDATLNVVWMVDTLVVVILGGMGTVLGPLFGAGLFVGLDTLLRSFAGEFATTIEGALIILFMLFAPQGVYGYFTERYGDEEEPPAATDPEAASLDGSTPEHNE